MAADEFAADKECGAECEGQEVSHDRAAGVRSLGRNLSRRPGLSSQFHVGPSCQRAGARASIYPDLLRVVFLCYLGGVLVFLGWVANTP